MAIAVTPAVRPALLGGMTLSLADVARLARVRREVVTVWRTRSAGTDTPFPAPSTGGTGGHLRYSAQDVVDWLAATDRGNNPDAAREAVLHADVELLAGSDAQAVPAVLALLALQALCGELPTDVDELLDLADEHDPDDEWAMSELTAAEPLLPQLVPWAAALSEAAFGPAGAAAAVMRRRSRAGRPSRPTLTPDGVSLLQALVLALVQRGPAAVVGDATGAAAEVLSGIAEGLTIAAAADAGTAARAARRELVLRGARWQPDVSSTVTLLGLPPTDGSTTTGVRLLQHLSEHGAAVGREVTTLVWGPASVLTDSLARGDRAPTDDDEQCDALRRGLLSSGRVRAIVRLPAGLRAQLPRERLALWVLGPTDELDQPRTIVGDLSDRTLDPALVSGLVTDVLAGLGGARGLRARQLETCVVRTGRWLAQHGPLVPVAPVRRRRTTAALLDTWDSSIAALPPTLATPTFRVREAPRDDADQAVATLLTTRLLSYRAGLRMTTAVDADDGGVPVLDARHGPDPVERVDRFELNRRYPQLEYTEAGDVVFSTAGRPRAFVDHRGGAVVRFPSKVLRSKDSRLLPEVLAAAINARPEGETAWRTWTVPLVDRTDVPAVRAGLAGLDSERHHLRRQLHRLDVAEQALLDLAAGGDVHVLPPRSPTDRHDPAPPDPAASAPNEEN